MSFGPEAGPKSGVKKLRGQEAQDLGDVDRGETEGHHSLRREGTRERTCAKEPKKDPLFTPHPDFHTGDLTTSTVLEGVSHNDPPTLLSCLCLVHSSRAG